MENFNRLIALLMAIQGYSKDLHYNVSGDGFYSKHLFADRIGDGIYDFIDTIKEMCLLGNGDIPLSSSEYMIMAIQFTPSIDRTSDTESFKKVADLIRATLDHIGSFAQDTSCGENNLICGIADDLQSKLGLLNRQIKT